MRDTTITVPVTEVNPATGKMSIDMEADWVPTTKRTFAVHREVRPDFTLGPCWSATHVRSGLSLGHYDTKREAVAVARAAYPLIDWSLVAPDGMPTDGKVRKPLRLLSETAKATLYHVARGTPPPRAPRGPSPFREAIEAADGWEAEDDWGAARCPCGTLIEPDGHCPSRGCGPNPARVAGLI